MAAALGAGVLWLAARRRPGREAGYPRGSLSQRILRAVSRARATAGA